MPTDDCFRALAESSACRFAGSHEIVLEAGSGSRGRHGWQAESITTCLPGRRKSHPIVMVARRRAH